jgi:hypothetical protein
LLPPKKPAISVAHIPVMTPGIGPAPDATESAIERGTDISATVSPDCQFDFKLFKIFFIDWASIHLYKVKIPRWAGFWLP